ncbi:MAG: general secretion pathway protein GspK [Bryobacterales bacterium]|nr:general secretion pathway protein GspK [Bryobacterales bacterium]MBV9397154.1 general secretion pathway protein GspK [Bryobacterales bacterium]
MSAALAAIAFSISSTVRSETDRVSTAADGLRASYLASGAVERGIQHMMWGPDYRNPDGSARFWEPNLPRMNLRFPSGEAVVEMIPESSKLNINVASADDLYRLALALTDDPARSREIADAIVEWRSPGGTGAPAALSLVAGQTFPPRHASFEEIEELLLVRGVTPELFYGNFVADTEGRLYARGGLRDAVSVWGLNAYFDVNTATPALLEALGVSVDGIAQIVQRRALRPFRDLGELNQLGISAPRLYVGGNYIWTLRATARLNTSTRAPSDVVRTSSATVKLLDRRQNYQMPVHVLRYYDDAWSQLALAPPGPGAPAQ